MKGDIFMNRFENVVFPHILFFGLIQTLELEDRTLIYKGGEDYKLIIGKEYILEEKNYSPNKEITEWREDKLNDLGI